MKFLSILILIMMMWSMAQAQSGTCLIHIDAAKKTLTLKNSRDRSQIVFSEPREMGRSPYRTGTWAKVNFADAQGHVKAIDGLGKIQGIASPLTDPKEICSPDGIIATFWIKSYDGENTSMGHAYFVNLKSGRIIDYSNTVHQVTEENFGGWKTNEGHTLQIMDGQDLHASLY